MRTENERPLDVERPRLAITANDDAIGHALEALDRTLDAWLAAIKLWHDRHPMEADSSPRTRHADVARTNQADLRLQPGPRGAAQASSRKEASRTAPKPVEATSPPGMPKPDAAPAAASAAESCKDLTVDAPAGNKMVHPASCDTDAAALVPDEPTAPSAPAMDEDEALLATLDPETARALRVMRRLSDNQRTVRDLLSEMDANKARPKPPETKRKSWWR